MRYSIRSLLLFTSVVALLMTSLLFVHRHFTQLFTGEPPGFVKDRGDWPQGLEELIADAGLTAPEIEKIRVYRSYDWGWDAEYIWEFAAQPELLKTLIDKHSLASVSTDGKLAEELIRKIPSEWNVCDLSQDHLSLFYTKFQDRVHGRRLVRCNP